MNESLRLLAYLLVATGVVVVSSGVLLRWRRRHPDPAEMERRRRLRVNRIGRLADGHIVELLDVPGQGDGLERVVVYNYQVRGVEYQSTQDISFFPEPLDLRQVATGRPATVKYDPQNPTNSIILCEEWSGI